jgi:methyl-accepting chemotaxis protein
MFHFFRVSLKKSFSILFGLQLILIILLAILILALYSNQGNLSKSRDASYDSYQLADQLRQSSDDLTRLVRTYVVTGNPEFEREYWAVLDIRNGKIPRPLDYDNIYWDFVSADGQKPRGDGVAVPLQELMVKEGFTEEEFGKLALAQKNSDGLVKIETIAMNAMKGLFEDAEGNFTIKKEPDQEMAIRIMHDENYHKTKAEIMRPIDDFYKTFEKRTSDAVSRYLNMANILYEVAILVSFLILILSIFSFIILLRQITDKNISEKKLSDLNNNLDKMIREKTSNLNKALFETEKLNKYMVGRELKMVELKKKIINLENNKNN